MSSTSGGHHDVAGDHRRPRPGERVEPAAGDPRPDVGAPLPAGRDELADDVDQRGDQRAQRVDRVGEVGVVAGAHPVPAGPVPARTAAGHEGQRAHGQADVLGVAGEQVAAAGAVDGEQAAAVGVPALDLGGVLGVRDGDHVVAVLLVPAEPEDVVVGAVQDAADAGAGLRAPVGVPVGQLVAALAQPGGERRHVAVAHGAPRGVVAQPVDLQEEHPGGVGGRCRWRPGGGRRGGRTARPRRGRAGC